MRLVETLSGLVDQLQRVLLALVHNLNRVVFQLVDHILHSLNDFFVGVEHVIYVGDNFHNFHQRLPVDLNDFVLIVDVLFDPIVRGLDEVLQIPQRGLELNHEEVRVNLNPGLNFILQTLFNHPLIDFNPRLLRSILQFLHVLLLALQILDPLIKQVQIRDFHPTPLQQRVLLRRILIVLVLKRVLLRLVINQKLLELLLRVLLPKLPVLLELVLQRLCLRLNRVKVRRQIRLNIPDLEVILDLLQIIPRLRRVDSLHLRGEREDLVDPQPDHVPDRDPVRRLLDLRVEMHPVVLQLQLYLEQTLVRVPFHRRRDQLIQMRQRG